MHLGGATQTIGAALVGSDDAHRLDVPEGTIKTRIRDALIKLRDLMGATP